jgi:cell division protein ZapA
MASSPVELKVGGQTYRVVASAEEPELKRLADLVDSRLRSLSGPGKPISPQSMLLAAISLAHDLEEERRRRLQLEARSKEMLRSVLARIDAALEAGDDRQEPAAHGSDGSAAPELHGEDFDV